jgi:hypothetical protein
VTDAIPDLRGKRVTCSRCQRSFINVAHDRFVDPAEFLGWEKGGVCEDCVIELAQKYVEEHGHAEATRRGIPLLVQYGKYRRKNGPVFIDGPNPAQTPWEGQ